MQIKTVRSALITNYEVLRLLEESQEAQKQVQKADQSVEYPEHLRTVQFEVIFFFFFSTKCNITRICSFNIVCQLTEYLKETPCSTQTPEQIKHFMDALSKYELTKAEKLQILNLRPKSTVEIYLVRLNYYIIPKPI